MLIKPLLLRIVIPFSVSTLKSLPLSGQMGATTVVIYILYMSAIYHMCRYIYRAGAMRIKLILRPFFRALLCAHKMQMNVNMNVNAFETFWGHN